MRKSILSHGAVLVLALQFFILPATLRAQFNYMTNAEGTITITGYTGPGGTVAIPSTVGDLPVTSIGAGAFYECRGLTNVVIPDSVTTIGQSAFAWCYSLTSLTIPGSVTIIGGGALAGCTGLPAIDVTTGNPAFTSVDGVLFDKSQTTLIQYPLANASENYTVPNSVTNIGEYAFACCRSLTSMTLPDSVTSIGMKAFQGCSLTNVTIPDSVTTIGELAFNACSLTSVTIGSNVTSIGEFAFAYDSGLATVAIPNSVTNLGDYAFMGCSGLTSVTIGGGVTSIGEFVFQGCGLTSVTIPNSVTSVGAGAFSGCPLTSLAIPNSVTSIRDWAFQGCTILTSVTIADSVTTIGSQAFEACSVLTRVTMGSGVTSIGDGAFQYCCFRLTSVTIPDSVTNIGNGAFADCYNLANVTIGNSVAHIGSGAFAYDSGLTRVTIPNSVTRIGDTAFLGCGNLTNVTIGNSVTNIGSGAFAYDSGLTRVTIPNSVTTIGSSAFAYCNLASVTIPNSVTSIGDTAFLSCSNLISAIIGNSVSSIGESVFQGCGLTNVTIPDSVASVGTGAFLMCSGLTSVTIGNGVTNIGNGAFAFCGLTSVTIPNSVISIGTNAFYACSSLKRVAIGNGVTNIVSGAFTDCPSLTAITVNAANTRYGTVDGVLFDKSQTILVEYPGGKAGNYTVPNGVTNIGAYAFASCYGLTKITMGDSVATIGEGAFQGCGLTNVMIPDSVTSIGTDAFFECFPLTSVSIGKNLTNIGSRAFAECASLTGIEVDAANLHYSSVAGVLLDKSQTSLIQYPIANASESYTVPNGVTNIGAYAFAFCYGLTSVTVGNGVVSIGDYAFNSCASLIGIYFQGDAPSLGFGVFGGDDDATIFYSPGTTGWGSTFGGLPVNLLAYTISGNGVTITSCTGSARAVTIPSTILGLPVTSIGDWAFNNCSSLASVVIPDSVTSIGGWAFFACTSLRSLTVPNGVTSIGNWAFYSCISLTNVTVGSSVSSIGAWAFLDCINLTSVTIGRNLTSIGDWAFYDCANLTGLYFEGNAPKLGGLYVFNGDNNARVYYLSGTTGWGPTFGGLPAVFWTVAITGTVTYYPQAYFPSTVPGPGVGNVTLSLTGDTNLSLLTLADGRYAQSNILAGRTYTVTPSKADDNPPYNNKGVDIGDLLAILEHYLGGPLLTSPYALLAADVNGDGVVDLGDVLDIVDMVLGNRSSFTAGLWRFVPADYAFPNWQVPWGAPKSRSYNNLAADVTGGGFIAIKLGDVDCSWTAPAAGPILLGRSAKRAQSLATGGVPAVVLGVSQQSAQPGQKASVGVSVSGFSQVRGAQFTLAWDPAVLRYKGTGDYGLEGVSGGSFGTRLTASGRLTFVWYDPALVGASLTDGTVLFTVSFEVIGKAGSVTAVAVGGSPTAQKVVADVGVVPVGARNGSVSVVGSGMLGIKPDYVPGVFRLSVPTEKGRSYTLEFSDSLTPAEWTALPAMTGDGTVIVLVDPGATNLQRYYRVRAQ